MADDMTTPFVDRDSKIADLFSSVIAPLKNPDEAYMNRALITRAGNNLPNPMIPMTKTTQPSPSVPATVTPSGTQSDTSEAQKLALEAMRKQMGATDAAEEALRSTPREDTASAAIQSKIATESKPIQARDETGKVLPEYRPSIGQRILRGLGGAGRGFLEGGLVGAAAGAISPRIVGGKGYGDPNKRYDVAEQNRVNSLVADTDSLTASRKAFEDATNRAKALSQEQRAVATGYKDVGTSATTQEEREEQARHNQADEKIRDKDKPAKEPTNDYEGIQAEAKRRFPNDPAKAYEFTRSELIRMKNDTRAPQDNSLKDLTQAIAASEFGMRQTQSINQQKEVERNRRYTELDKNIQLKYDANKLAAAKQQIDSELETKYGPMYQEVNNKVDAMLGLTKSGQNLKSTSNPQTAPASTPAAKTEKPAAQAKPNQTASAPKKSDFPLTEFKGHKAGDIVTLKGGQKVKITGFNDKGQFSHVPAS